jgi:hypothetical protein
MASITGTLVDNSGQERVAGTFTFSGTSTTGDLTVTGLTATSINTPTIIATVAATGINVGGASDKLGFYAHAPTLLQTGVAVSSAGIHAALVNLGLITA